MGMVNFTPLRNGLLDHVRHGKLSPTDLGVYTFLHLIADWGTGICYTCAAGIATQFGDPKHKVSIQKSLRRLRDRQYINYRKGDGLRNCYPILINKYEPTVGELSGTRLNAWTHGQLALPEYEPQNGNGTVEERLSNGGGTVKQPIQDLKTLDVQDRVKTSAQAKPERGNGNSRTQANIVILASEIYSCYPRKIAKDDALRATGKAIQKIAARGLTELHPDFKGDHKLAATWLQKRVTLYRNSPQGRRLDKDKIPYPATWMNAGQYDDNPQEWTHVSNSQSAGKSNGKAVVTSSALDSQKTLLREANSEGVI